MKKRTLFLIILYSSICFSQNRNLTVDYILYIAEDLSETNSFKKDIMRGVINESGKIHFNLFINDSISNFVENNGISSSNLSAKLAMNKTKYITPIYYYKNILSFKNNPSFIFFDRDEYLIEKKSISEWFITTESKLINGKTCFKATAKDYFHNKGKLINYDITAWFCPQLPYNFGPVYYNNLPGLILEISYLDIKLVATSIIYELDKSKIKKPTGQKTVTIDNYYILQENKLAEMYEELEKQRSGK